MGFASHTRYDWVYLESCIVSSIICYSATTINLFTLMDIMVWHQGASNIVIPAVHGIHTLEFTIAAPSSVDNIKVKHLPSYQHSTLQWTWCIRCPVSMRTTSAFGMAWRSVRAPSSWASRPVRFRGEHQRAGCGSNINHLVLFYTGVCMQF